MRSVKILATWIGVLVVVFGSPGRLSAQGSAPKTVGQNAVVQSSTGPVVPVNSPAFVDASVYNTDICTAIADVLKNWTPSNSNGIVIDARSITSLNCSGNPWAGLSGSGFINTVLLPAAPITINQTWVPISDTRIIGEGPNLTILQAGASFPMNGDMIDMGSQTACVLSKGLYDCTSVVIEHLGLNGGGISGVNGIVNYYSEELSYVNDVAFTNFAGGTGLLLGVNCSGGCTSTSNNSGPYTNLYYSGSGPCMNIMGKSPTAATDSLRGVHGLTCTTSSNPAISLDASNTTMEDITIIGSSSSQDGILIGSNTGAGARADALRNIRAGGGTLGNLIHISSAVYTGTPPGPDVSELTILGVTKGTANVAIQDDLSGPSGGTTLQDQNIAMYVLGEPLSTGTGPGYSRFTTSPNVPTWLFGTNPPSGSCATGSLYSCTNSTSCTKTLWGCAGQQWVGVE